METHMNYRTAFFILALVFGVLVAYLIFKPKDDTNEYYTEKYKKSVRKQKAIASGINQRRDNFKKFRDEIKRNDSIVVHADGRQLDSVLTKYYRKRTGQH